MTRIEAQVLALEARWRAELRAAEGNPRLDRIEQAAWDVLVDYVEAHDLSYTRLDPRGPRDDGKFDPVPWDERGAGA